MTWPIAAVAVTALVLAACLLGVRWLLAFKAAQRVTDGETAKLADQHEQLVAKLKALEEKLTIINNRQR